MDVLENAVCNFEIGSTPQQPDAPRFDIDAFVSHPVRGGCQVPMDVGEPEGEAPDVHVAHPRTVDHADPPRDFHADRVRVGISGKSQEEPTSVSFFVKPELAGTGERMWLVFQVVATAPDDLE